MTFAFDLQKAFRHKIWGTIPLPFEDMRLVFLHIIALLFAAQSGFAAVPVVHVPWKNVHKSGLSGPANHLFVADQDPNDDPLICIEDDDLEERDDDTSFGSSACEAEYNHSIKRPAHFAAFYIRPYAYLPRAKRSAPIFLLNQVFRI